MKRMGEIQPEGNREVRLPHTLLKRTDLLDPAPIRDGAAGIGCPEAVHIPLSELPGRVHELPPRGASIRVLDCGADAAAAVEWLRRHGRRAELVLPSSPDSIADPARYRLWEPTGYLSERVSAIPAGNAVELACGTGRDAVFLASLGWRVTAVDVLPDAIERAARLAERYTTTPAEIIWRCMDLEQDPPHPALQPGGEFAASFDLVTGFRYLHRPHFAMFELWLRPGGQVVYETFTTENRTRHGKPGRDAHVLLPGELPALLPGFEVLHHAEGWHLGVHTARIHARKC